jgi:hypothetical protein
MNGHHVRTAEASDREACLDTLMLAFGADPCIRYVFPRAEAFVASFAPFATALGGAAIERGTAYRTGDGDAVALWLPPGVGSDSEAIGALLETSVSAEKQEVLGQVLEGMGQYHPQAPHWYLAMIGVDPSRQGRAWAPRSSRRASSVAIKRARSPIWRVQTPKMFPSTSATASRSWA